METKSRRRIDCLAIAGFCAFVILFCILSEASPYFIRFFGIQLPVLCPFRLLTGFDCPVCGLTRSLVLAYHGYFRESYLTNMFGIPLAFFFLFQIPYQIRAGISAGKIGRPYPAFNPRLGYLILVCALLPWTLKTVAVALILWR
jgi:Protein of unknown function (DUF2752)